MASRTSSPQGPVPYPVFLPPCILWHGLNTVRTRRGRANQTRYLGAYCIRGLKPTQCYFPKNSVGLLFPKTALTFFRDLLGRLLHKVRCQIRCGPMGLLPWGLLEVGGGSRNRPAGLIGSLAAFRFRNFSRENSPAMCTWQVGAAPFVPRWQAAKPLSTCARNSYCYLLRTKWTLVRRAMAVH